MDVYLYPNSSSCKIKCVQLFVWQSYLNSLLKIGENVIKDTQQTSVLSCNFSCYFSVNIKLFQNLKRKRPRACPPENPSGSDLDVVQFFVIDSNCWQTPQGERDKTYTMPLYIAYKRLQGNQWKKRQNPRPYHYSFNKYLLSTYHVPDTVLEVVNKTTNKCKDFCPT